MTPQIIQMTLVVVTPIPVSSSAAEKVSPKPLGGYNPYGKNVRQVTGHLPSWSKVGEQVNTTKHGN